MTEEEQQFEIVLPVYSDETTTPSRIPIYKSLSGGRKVQKQKNSKKLSKSEEKENRRNHRVKNVKSGLHADVSSDSGSEIDEGFDLDSVLQNRVECRKTGGRRRKLDDANEHVVSNDNEWSITVENHKNSTPLKAIETNEGQSVIISASGKDLFQTPGKSKSSKSLMNSPLEQSKSLGISQLHRQLFEKAMASQKSTPKRASSSLSSSQRSSKEATPSNSPFAAASSTDEKTPLRRLGIIDQNVGNDDTPRTRVTRRSNALANEFQRLRDDASDGDEDNFVDLHADTDKAEADAKNSGKQKKHINKGVTFKEYFQDLNDSAKLKTSNNTLDLLVELDYEEYRQLLLKLEDINLKSRYKLLHLHRNDFSQWRFEMKNGFNLLFYGFGSKRKLLNEFAKFSIDQGYLVVIHGFFPSLSYREIISAIIRNIVKYDGPLGSLQNQTALIHEHFNSNETCSPLYLLIHNLDGPQLRSEKIQASISRVAQAKKIHLIASVDHINAFTMWDSRLSSQFSFTYHDLTTFNSYQAETTDETYTAWMNRFLRGKGASQIGGTSIRAALFVLNTVTKNSRDLFRILANHQIQMQNNSSSNEINNSDLTNAEDKLGSWTNAAMPRTMLFQRCREQFIVASDANFKTQMRELLDHKVVESHIMIDGTEVVFTPFSNEALQQILDDLMA